MVWLMLSLLAQSEVKVADPPDLSTYEEVVGRDVMDELRFLASRVKGRTFRHVNATPEGGGVAEILHRMIPFLRGLGVDARWHVLEGTPEFFEVTKKFHNGLQGAPVTLSADERRTYDEVLARNAKRIPLDADVWLVHDPQPAGLVRYIREVRPDAKIAWRVHIDTSNANPDVWDFVSSRARGADVALFHMPEFVKGGSGAAPVIMQPSIDPLSAKNAPMSEAEMRDVLAKYGIALDKPLVTQVSRFDTFKDPMGVMESFVKLRESGTDARLVYVGSGSVDDPEGMRVYEEVMERYRELERTKPEIARDMKIMMTDYDPALVNAIQRKSAVILQLSTKEGFGLTATEAMWKGTPVIARPAGGLKSQVIDGKTGFLVATPAEAAARMKELIESPELRARMGAAAREHVRENFLLTRNVRNYLLLMQPGFYDAAKRGGTMQDVYARMDRAARREATGAGQFAAAYLLKEAMNGRLAVRDLAHPGFWGDLAVFTLAARMVEAAPMRGLLRAGLPLAAGMAAVQLIHGQLSWRDVAIDTASFLAAGALVSAIADGLIYPALFAAGPPGWIAAGVYTVAKLAVTLYAGEKLGSWLRSLFARGSGSVGVRSGREGVAQKVEALNK